MEGEVGYFRRNHLVPVPRVKDLAELNTLLLDGCRQDRQRRIAGKTMAVGEAMEIERQHLLAPAEEGFELAETSFPTVDGKSCVKVRTNWYSTPVSQAHASECGCFQPMLRYGMNGGWWRGMNAASAATSRCWTWNTTSTYSSVSRVRWPVRGPCNSGVRTATGRSPSTGSRSLEDREGKQAGTRTMIELLQHGSRHGWEKLKQAVEQALDIGCTNARRCVISGLRTTGARAVKTLALSQLNSERPCR